ncbi:MAG: hypothetical protein OXR73_25730 [Myxococcales bacterium]|nr:hypothetical protein [Myxococcales bacterium]
MGGGCAAPTALWLRAVRVAILPLSVGCGTGTDMMSTRGDPVRADLDAGLDASLVRSPTASPTISRTRVTDPRDDGGGAAPVDRQRQDGGGRQERVKELDRVREGTRASDAGLEEADASQSMVQVPEPVPSDVVPWGVAPSASSSRILDRWAPLMAEAGVRWVRGFDASQPEWTFDTLDRSGLALSGILQLRLPGEAVSFPVSDLPAWEQYAKGAVERAGEQVAYWEVWNEPPNFSENKAPADYAKIVVSAYNAVKAGTPSARIGIAAQSVNLNFLAQALDAGARNHFDFVTLHPYEILDLVREGWEPLFMNIVPTVRKLLADKSPEQRDVPVLFTELGLPIGARVTLEEQADILVKAYVLSLAQGVKRVHWFEPLDGDSGRFGLVDRHGAQRPSYTALRALVSYLGEQPQYVGWSRLGGEAYGFVFEGTDAPVLVAWTPPEIGQDVDMATEVGVIRPGYGTEMRLTGYTLTNSPVIIAGIPTQLVAEARENAGKPLLWGGDFTTAGEVSYAGPGAELGLHPAGNRSLITIDGIQALDATGRGSLRFAVDPGFNSYAPARFEVEAEFRSLTEGRAWFTLRYEAVDGWVAAGEPYDVPNDDQWHTQKWTLENTQFVGKWGYHFDFDSNLQDESAYCVRSVKLRKLE